MQLKGQGAIELSSRTTAGTLVGQGATEYLVLLAVVLIVALVSVALLGFFPGMASDAQQTQSKTYWASASPISIIEWGARNSLANGGAGPELTVPYLRLRNTGAYTITITKMLVDGYSASRAWTGGWAPDGPIAYQMGPGEEIEIGRPPYFTPDPGSGNRRFFPFITNGGGKSVSSGSFYNIPASYCTRTAPYGTFVVNNFGFEYTVTVEGQTLTKRQIGAKPLAIKCTNAPYDW